MLNCGAAMRNAAAGRFRNGECAPPSSGLRSDQLIWRIAEHTVDERGRQIDIASTEPLVMLAAIDVPLAGCTRTVERWENRGCWRLVSHQAVAQIRRLPGVHSQLQSILCSVDSKLSRA
jgi:hypothetical protein